MNLIRADMSWDGPDWASHKPPESDEEDDPHNEREEEIEGSRQYEVGWMTVRAEALIPCLYSVLIKHHFWDHIYARPPEVSAYY